MRPSEVIKSKITWLLLLLIGVISFRSVLASYHSMNRIESNKISQETILQTSSGLRMVADEMDLMGGDSESNHFKMQISTGGQPSPIGISHGIKSQAMAGYVYAAFVSHGDANADGIIDVGDVVLSINYLYREGSSPIPLEAGDVNCNGITDVGDVVFLINYLYRNGISPCDPLG
jgi:hypothetical protein